jgi:hypothetical protein
MAAYRLFDNDRVTMEAILKSHLDTSCNRISEEPVVLCIGDTTQLDFTTMPDTDGFGPLSKEFQKGLFLHPILAVTPDRLGLGVINSQIWARDPDNFGEKRKKRPMDIEHRESFRWIQDYRALCSLAERVPKTKLVYITDREGDIAHLLAEAQPRSVDILIRAKHNRTLDDDEKLWSHMDSSPVLGTITFELPTAPKRKSRTVTQEVRAAIISIEPERYG